MDFDLEELVNVEQTFYEDGYKDGYAHGRIHGLIEGRALGREKGFEMWEELGFYEGFARMWKAILDAQGASAPDERAQNHIRHLLALIAQFPRMNPSRASRAGGHGHGHGPGHADGEGRDSGREAAEAEEAEADIPRLFRQIRSRYKLLCATLGVRPTMRAADGAASSPSPDRRADVLVETGGTAGPSMDQPKKKTPVWAVHDPSRGAAGTELSF
ncbi:hypothetical protein C8Q80DRAFT_266587 [Daedaleopsis nitida]|nr:hypothetical protein C8Q80DRAFT_266587 [Daedaleopsis nitida]